MSKRNTKANPTQAQAKSWKVCGNHVVVEPGTYTREDLCEMALALSGGDALPIERSIMPASKAATAHKEGGAK